MRRRGGYGTTRTMKRYDLINEAIRKGGYSRYLEIGLRDGRCFDRIECEFKHSVDPDFSRRAATYRMTSRQFWRTYGGPVYDVIFVDGSHLAEEVLNDLENAISFIQIHGAVFVHDVYPEAGEHTHRAYSGRGTWNGDAWKAWVHFKRRHPELQFKLHEDDHGVGEVRYRPLTFEDDLWLVK